MNRYGKISKLVFAVLFTRIRDVKDMYSKLYSNLQKLNSAITMRLMLKVFLGSIVVLITALPIILNASALPENPIIWFTTLNKDDVISTSPINVSVNASGYEGEVINVTFIVGGATQGMTVTVTGGPTWTWTSGPIKLAEGQNNITAIATDNYNHSNQTSVFVNYTPTISIRSPEDKYESTTSSITVSGTALNNSTFRMVEVNVNNGSWKNASGTDSWNITVELSEGSNTIYARANYTASNSNNASITVIYTPPDDKKYSGGSSGGGGGGSGGSGENFSNINVIEKYDQPIYKDVMTSYKFINPKNPIIFVNITGNTNYDGVTTLVEALKDTSSIVKSAATGDVYMNVNIWVGTSGFATPKNIKEAVIRFRVENSWIDDLSNEDIKLLRWDGSKWVTLKTSEISKDSTFTYFEAYTDSFSPFAITSLKEKPSLVGAMFSQEKTSTEKAKKSDGNKAKGNKPESNKPDVLMNWFIISAIFVLIGLIIEVLRIKKK